MRNSKCINVCKNLLDLFLPSLCLGAAPFLAFDCHHLLFASLYGFPTFFVFFLSVSEFLFFLLSATSLPPSPFSLRFCLCNLLQLTCELVSPSSVCYSGCVYGGCRLPHVSGGGGCLPDNCSGRGRVCLVWFQCEPSGHCAQVRQHLDGFVQHVRNSPWHYQSGLDICCCRR